MDRYIKSFSPVLPFITLPPVVSGRDQGCNYDSTSCGTLEMATLPCAHVPCVTSSHSPQNSLITTQVGWRERTAVKKSVAEPLRACQPPLTSESPQASDSILTHRGIY